MDKIFLNVSFSMLCGVFAIFALSFLGFIIKVDVNPLYTIIGLIVTFCVLNYRCKDLEKKKRHTINRVVLLVLVLIWAISASLHDNTIDGFTYHMPIASLIAKGYNPIYDNVFDVTKAYFLAGNKSIIWIECYTKFSEIFAANIFSLTKNLEAGKIFNYLAAVIAFLYAFYIFSKKNFKPLDKKMCFIFSFLLIYNPVVIYQASTFYVDGLLYLYFLIGMLSFIDFYLDKKDKMLPLLIFIMASVILANIKFGGLLCFICLVFAGVIFFKNVKKLKKFYCAVLISLILILLSGINPYFTNLKQNRNAFYPMVGKDKIDIVSHATPKDFIKKPYFYSFFVSMFSKSSSDATYGKAVLKIPFTTDIKEICAFDSAYTKTGGFGVFFSGIFLYSLFMLFMTKFKKRNRGAFILLLALSGLPVILNPINWWARYIPYLWSFAVFIIMAAYINSSSKFRRYSTLGFILLMFINSLLVNISLFLAMF